MLCILQKKCQDCSMVILFVYVAGTVAMVICQILGCHAEIKSWSMTKNYHVTNQPEYGNDNHYTCNTCIILAQFFLEAIIICISVLCPTQCVDGVLESPCLSFILSMILSAKFYCNYLDSWWMDWFQLWYVALYRLGTCCKRFWLLYDINFLNDLVYT